MTGSFWIVRTLHYPYKHPLHQSLCVEKNVTRKISVFPVSLADLEEYKPKAFYEVLSCCYCGTVGVAKMKPKSSWEFMFMHVCNLKEQLMMNLPFIHV